MPLRCYVLFLPVLFSSTVVDAQIFSSSGFGKSVEQARSSAQAALAESLWVDIKSQLTASSSSDGKQQAQFEVEKFWVGALKRAVIDGDVTKGSLMAGQSVGLVKQVMPLKDIIDEFTRDAEAELQRLKGVLTDEDAKE